MISLEQGNSTLAKPGLPLGQGGPSQLGPIIVPATTNAGPGFKARLVVPLLKDETVTSIILTDPESGLGKTLSFVEVLYEARSTISFDQSNVFTSDTPKRNVVTLTTSKGVTRKQFFCKNEPSVGAVYINGEEAQVNTVILYRGQNASQYSNDISFSINILPTFSDELFVQHEYNNNRYANTIRNWGGAKTAEIFGSWQTGPIIEEQDIGDIMGYYWDGASTGSYTITVRLRSLEESDNYIDLFANVEVQDI